MADNQNITDFRPFLEDLLRLGMQDVPGFANRTVEQIQLEYITNPYGRQPPHILFFPDGRVDRMTPFQLPVPGYAANVLAVELMGYVGQKPTDVQLKALRDFGQQVRSLLAGKVGFTGNAELVSTATRDESASPGFMAGGQLSMADIVPPAPPSKLSNVQSLFDILGTPGEKRSPLPPGSIFNSVNNGNGLAAVVLREMFKAPGTRIIKGLVVIPSHDPFKPQPEEASAYTLEALRKADQRIGMSDFRGHYILARDGTLVPGRDLEKVGNSWPGKNEGTIQIVLAGNGKAPTAEQRATLYHYGVAMRKYYEYPLTAHVRDILYAEQLLGIDPNHVMVAENASPALIEAPIATGGAGRAQRHA